jgi:hypothetical protein
MGKFTDLTKAVMGVFADPLWTAENIKTYPNNFVGEASGNEFIRVSIIPGSFGVNMKSVAGIIQIEIFVASGEGVSRYAAIADKLDSFLVHKSRSVSGSFTQFHKSTLSAVGRDKDNPALYRALYSIPFNHFGV